MNEKMKKVLMRELYKGAAASVILIVIFTLCSIFPYVREGTVSILAKNADLKKVASLFLEIAKEIAP